jgi:hypothetical protein
MTDLAPIRHTVNTLNSDALDAIYSSLEAAEATLDRARALRDDLRGITGARYIADMLDKILDPPGPAPAEAPRPASWLTAGTRDLSIPAAPVPCPACARAGQAGLDPTEQHPHCRTTREQR